MANSVTFVRRDAAGFWLALSYAEARWRAISNAFAHISGAISRLPPVCVCVETLINLATIAAIRSLCSSVSHPKALCSDNSLSFLKKNYSALLKQLADFHTSSPPWRYIMLSLNCMCTSMHMVELV